MTIDCACREPSSKLQAIYTKAKAKHTQRMRDVYNKIAPSASAPTQNATKITSVWSSSLNAA